MACAPCAPGFTLTPDGLSCQRITSVAPTANATTYTIVGVTPNTPNGGNGAIFYNLDNTTISQILPPSSTTIWGNGGAGSPTSRINLEGVWTNSGSGLPVGEWVGFSYCLEVETAGYYNVSMGGDNRFRFFVDGILVVEKSGPGTQPFTYENIYQIFFTAGTHVIVLEGYNEGDAAVLYAEIFSVDNAVLRTVTDVADAGRIFTTKSKIGQNFDTGESTTGYSCPPGYTLSLCDGPPMCVLIETTDANPCDDECQAVLILPTTFCTGSEVTFIDASLGSVYDTYHLMIANGDMSEVHDFQINGGVPTIIGGGTIVGPAGQYPQYKCTFTLPGVYDYTYQVTREDCDSTISGQIIVNEGVIGLEALNQGPLLYTADGFVSYQWYLGGVAIHGATARQYIATETGTYYVIATRAGGCSGQSNDIILTDTDMAVPVIYLMCDIKVNGESQDTCSTNGSACAYLGDTINFDVDILFKYPDDLICSTTVNIKVVDNTTLEEVYNQTYDENTLPTSSPNVSISIPVTSTTSYTLTVDAEMTCDDDCQVNRSCSKTVNVCLDYQVQKQACHVYRLIDTNPADRRVTNVEIRTVQGDFVADYIINEDLVNPMAPVYLNYLDVTLPGDGIYVAKFTVPDTEGFKEIIIYDLCDLITCTKKLTLEIFCNEDDPCCNDCDKTKANQKEIDRQELNKLVALNSLLFSSIYRSQIKYFGIYSIDECRQLDLQDINNIFEKINAITKKCGDCNKATQVNIAKTTPCPNC